ncbi:uncharacterized protein N7473_000953 [Penicillium subrubescens]|uniref:uncharacterized protein n=1 Tax=Penicillium subrubescens TaxID=1316194 RepID=UPI0025455AB5|nr:uncharacterized protein N7473_000953 [Penicillium subrubescens]KAJ5911650.1 hypothetical protein N7473_000953 [Penicillium subrubescens]
MTPFSITRAHAHIPQSLAHPDCVRVGVWGRLPMAAKGLGLRRYASPMCGEPGGGHRLVLAG